MILRKAEEAMASVVATAMIQCVFFMYDMLNATVILSWSIFIALDPILFEMSLPLLLPHTWNPGLNIC